MVDWNFYYVERERVCECVYVCVLCVRLRKREKEREGEREGGRERERQRETAIAMICDRWCISAPRSMSRWVCICARKRKRERERDRCGNRHDLWLVVW